MATPNIKRDGKTMARWRSHGNRAKVRLFIYVNMFRLTQNNFKERIKEMKNIALWPFLHFVSALADVFVVHLFELLFFYLHENDFIMLNYTFIVDERC